MTDQNPTAPRSSTPTTARVMSIIGAVFAVVAIVLFPIVFGPIGAILGFVGYAKGDKPFGLWVGIGAIVATIVGFILGAIVFNAVSN